MLGYVIELLEAVKYKFDFRIDLDTFRHLPRAAIFLAIQHPQVYNSLTVSMISKWKRPSPREDFLMFVPTIDKGPLSTGSRDTCYSSLYRREFNEGNGNSTSIEQALTETEALYKLGQQVLPLGESTWQYPTHRAAIARQFTILSRVHAQQRRPTEAAKYLDLARHCTKVHAVRALVEIEGMNQRIMAYKSANNHSQLMYRDLVTDLKRSYGKAVSEVEAHLGPHHPLHVCIHQEVAELFATLAQLPSILSESLQAHQRPSLIPQKPLEEFINGPEHKSSRLVTLIRIWEIWMTPLTFIKTDSSLLNNVAQMH